ncbi:MAG TPA: hypothetical protein VGI81_02135 [Tepidisphaeraceae bacterium]|jgi:hypothetical protein
MMQILEYGRPDRHPRRRLIAIALLTCGFVGVLLFRIWHRAAPVPTSISSTVIVSQRVSTPSRTTTVADFFLIIEAKNDGARPVFSCPSVQSTTREAPWFHAGE